MSGGVEVGDILLQKVKSKELCDRGVASFQDDDVQEALSLVRQAIEVNPYHEQAYSNLGFILIKKGDYEEAIDVLEEVLAFCPHREEAKRYLATAKEKQGSGHTGPETKDDTEDEECSEALEYFDDPVPSGH